MSEIRLAKWERRTRRTGVQVCFTFCSPSVLFRGKIIELLCHSDKAGTLITSALRWNVLYI